MKYNGPVFLIFVRSYKVECHPFCSMYLIGSYIDKERMWKIIFHIRSLIYCIGSQYLLLMGYINFCRLSIDLKNIGAIGEVAEINFSIAG